MSESRILIAAGAVGFVFAWLIGTVGGWSFLLPFAAASFGLWNLALAWKALGPKPPTRRLVAVTLGVGALLFTSGGYYSVVAATELVSSSPASETGGIQMRIGLGVIFAAFGAVLLAKVIARAFPRRSPPGAEPSNPPA